jgi:hypothetical protein
MTVVRAVLVPCRFNCSKVASRLLAFFTGIEVVCLLRCCGAALLKSMTLEYAPLKYGVFVQKEKGRL